MHCNGLYQDVAQARSDVDRWLHADRGMLEALGWLSFSQHGGALRFIGMRKCYEKTTRIIITIPSFPQCASIFDDDVRATRRASASRCLIQDLFPPLRPRINVTTRGA